MHPRPSLTALRAFEAVARHLSMSAAAAELHVSRPAVSRQMRLLEAELGTSLLMRSGSAISLTPAGAELFAGLARGFDLIAATTEAVSRRARDDRRLRILVCRDFASSWLSGQIGEFMVKNPGIAIEITVERNGHFRLGEDFDIRIFYGLKGVHADARLQETELCRWIDMPVCTRGFHESHLANGQRPCEAPHLSDSNYDIWEEWCQLTGVEAGGARQRNTVFNETTLCLSVARSGAGLTIGDSFLAFPAILAGELMVPFSKGLVSSQSYSLFTANGHLQPAVRRFEIWLKDAINRYQKKVEAELSARGIALIERQSQAADIS